MNQITENTRITELDTDECWAALESQQLGRFAVRVGDGVDIFPVNYLLNNHTIYFRSAPGSKLLDLTNSPTVAFEADGRVQQRYWSVVVHGTAARLMSDADIEESGVLALRTWSATEKFNYVRITPTTITGRRFLRQF